MRRRRRSQARRIRPPGRTGPPSARSGRTGSSGHCGQRRLLSVGGDQLARVALTLLVYDRTHSALLAAVTFVASIIPEFLGGVLLAGLADRWPRRDLMIACDLTRAVLVTVMALRPCRWPGWWACCSP